MHISVYTKQVLLLQGCDSGISGFTRPTSKVLNNLLNFLLTDEPTDRRTGQGIDDPYHDHKKGIKAKMNDCFLGIKFKMYN